MKRTLDGMAAVKLNVLHWHLTDDQGFRVESQRFPKLTELGSDGLYYTQDQVRDVVAYARERGIRVVPEFDMPGHTTRLVGRPSRARDAARAPTRSNASGGSTTRRSIRRARRSTRSSTRFLGEMAALFPDAYLHIGGDEVNGKHWNASPRVQAVHARARA